jgi:hypothetical protein
MQLAVLDRIAGTQAAAADLGSQLRRLRALDAQLASIDALGDVDTRDALQLLVDEVHAMSCPVLGSAHALAPGRMPTMAHDLLLVDCCPSMVVHWCSILVVTSGFAPGVLSCPRCGRSGWRRGRSGGCGRSCGRWSPAGRPSSAAAWSAVLMPTHRSTCHSAPHTCPCHGQLD